MVLGLTESYPKLNQKGGEGMVSLEGTFVLVGDNRNIFYNSEGKRLVIRERKAHTESKPKNFLIAATPHYEYVSSLFPTVNEGEYRLDYQGQVYAVQVQKEEGEVHIRKAD